MYHTHFGLERGLFDDGIAADPAVFRGPKHDYVSAQFKLALGSPSSVLLLRGPAGVGKTTLTSAALRASSTTLALAWLNATPANAAELLELILVELGLGTVGTTRIERLQLWRQFQGEMRATGSRLFVVVERTEDLAPEVLHALDALTAPDAAGNLGANVVLLGHAGLDDHLAAPVLESFRQRIRLRAELTPFTQAELEDYLRHQVGCAGGHYDRVFAPGAAAALYRYSGGVARLANTLCATALELAASRSSKLLTAELAAETAASMLGLAATSSARATQPAVDSAATAPAGPPPLTRAVPELAPAAAISPATAVAPAAAVRPAAVVAPIAAVRPAATVAPAAPAMAAPPAPAPVKAAAPPAPPPPPRASTPASFRNTAPVEAAPPTTPVEPEFDGGATDISDAAVADFPILTDAVDPPAVTPVKRVIPARAAALAGEDEPPRRHTQLGKSIDDISSSMAETLFGDAELDLVTAALAAAAESTDEDQPFTAVVSARDPARPATPVEDPFDLFGLGDDAPLELIDDSAQPPAPDRGALKRSTSR